MEPLFTVAQIEDVQAELFADDVPILPEMIYWAAKDIEAYFVSDGLDKPNDKPIAAGPATQEQSYRVVFAPRSGAAARTQYCLPCHARTPGTFAHVCRTHVS